jgi:hypothetical protein
LLWPLVKEPVKADTSGKKNFLDDHDAKAIGGVKPGSDEQPNEGQESTPKDVPIGDLLSHAQGDLNLDGITNIQDLLLMQSALSGIGMGTITASEQAGVPEPASALLAIFALLPIAVRRRPRRRATIRLYSPAPTA